jgi:hypothetical protein
LHTTYIRIAKRLTTRNRLDGKPIHRIIDLTGALARAIAKRLGVSDFVIAAW